VTRRRPPLRGALGCRFLECFAVLCLLFSLTACGVDINERRFRRIGEGMTLMEAVNLLGEPASTRRGTGPGPDEFWSVWADEDARITVRFVNGRVVEARFERLDSGKPGGRETGQ